MEEEFRVEVELEREEDALAVGEQLRALELNDEAKALLGPALMVTQDGPHVFLYAAGEAEAREAEEVVRRVVGAEEMTAELRVTRWHPVEEAWKDASLPLPSTPEEEATEYAAREVAEEQEAEIEGEYDWHVVVHLPSRHEAAELAKQLGADGVHVTRRWRYVVAGVLTEERADELADRLRAELPADADVRIEVDLSDLTRSPLQFLPF